MKCVSCGSDQFDLVHEDEVISVRGRKYTIPNAERHRCRSCGEEILTGEQAEQLDKQLVAMRRRSEGLLNPEQIKEIRERLGLSQLQLSRLLGAGDKTVARWECGMVIQNKMADDLLRLLGRNPANIYVLAKERLGIQAPMYSLEKAAAVIAYLLLNKVQMGITKLMKLLYKADFEAAKRLGAPITGATYEAWDLGPVPREIHQALTREDRSDLPIRVEVGMSGKNRKFYNFTPDESVDPSCLSDDERSILDEVWQRYGRMDIQELIQEVHEDQAWKNAYPNKVIVYPVLMRSGQ